MTAQKSSRICIVAMCALVWALPRTSFAQPIAAIGSETADSVQIGSQTWMRHNLAVTRFRNGDEVPQIVGSSAWAQAGRAGTPGWSYYQNTVSPPENWGPLYNYAAVNDSRGLCPLGWRVPNNTDWRQLETTLGGGGGAAASLKAQTGWPTQGAGTNRSGFGALPAGFRTQRGEFFLGRRVAYFWSLGQARDGTTTAHMLFDDMRPLFRIAYDPAMGMSLRCIAEQRQY